MKNLLRFLYKYAHTIFFIILQCFCIYLIFIYNNYHQSVFLSSSNKITGTSAEIRNNINNYFFLKTENKKLIKENKELLNKLEFYRKEKPISLKTRTYSYIAAEIINASKNKTKNYLTINKGANDGVKPEMGVISSEGVVGITYIVGKNFTTILPLINTKFGLSVKLKKNDFFGSASWDGINIRRIQMYEIPGYVEIEEGDIVVTSGFSAFFPAEIPVGEIISYRKDKATEFYDIELELFTDFNKINHVYIIDNILYEEQKEIEKNTDDN